MLRPRITKSLAVVSNQLPELPSVEPEVKRIDNSDPNYHPFSKSLATGKAYQRLKTYSISPRDCIQADRLFTSIRQQSDFQKSTVGENNIAASSATVYRKREQCRLDALRRCEDDLRQASAIQLCYDGKILNHMDRYVFLGQIVNQQKHIN